MVPLLKYFVKIPSLNTYQSYITSRQFSFPFGKSVVGILSLSLSCALLPSLCYANSTEKQEIEALKTQLKSLESHIHTLEQRQVTSSPRKRTHTHHSSAPLFTNNSKNTNSPIVGDNNTIENKRPVDPDYLIPNNITGLADSSDPNDSYVKINTAIRKSSINLDSSSPLAITQTNVQNLPPIFKIGGVSVKIGGYIDVSDIYRDKNMVSGPITVWNNFPYRNNPNSRIDENRITAQGTRLSALLEGHPSNNMKLQAYIESDFASSGTTSNSVQVNGYTPRLRQAYLSFDNDNWGFHFMGGQAWSLSTSYAKGLLGRNEQLPPVMDNNLIPSVPFTRVAQIRLVKDWQKKYWLGISFEDPQQTVGFSNTLDSGGDLPAAYGQTGKTRVYFNSAGSGTLNSLTKYSLTSIPDMIVKGAVDTSFGHYEVFALGRWFRTQAMVSGSSTTRTRTKMGGGVGGGATIPILQNRIQLTGSLLAGEGVGRYDGVQIPDTTFTADGAPTPIPEIIGNVGIIGHPRSDLLIYSYAGADAVGRRTYIGADGKEYGYGARSNNLAGCGMEFGTCDAQTKTFVTYTLGGWWHALDGDFGSVLTGVQYTYIRKFAFRGNDGLGHSVNPAADGNTVYMTFRYFPFQ